MPNKNIKMQPIENPKLIKVMQEVKNGSTKENQEKLTEELKKAKLLAPCDFDVRIDQIKNGKIQNVQPTQIKFFLINTNDGKTFFPLFTDLEHVKKFSFGKDVQPQNVVREVKDYHILLSQPNQKAIGCVINPGSENIVVPKGLVDVIAGKKPMPTSVVPKNNAPLVARYSDPSVYPTKLAMEVYDRAEATKEIEKVWLKQKTVGNEGSFILVVKSSSNDEHILNEIREVAVPNAKNVPVEVVFLDETNIKTIVNGAAALYDRELDL